MTRKRIIAGLFIITLGLFGCGAEPIRTVSPNSSPLPDAPEIHEVSAENAPIYFFMFTHTEDHFNHELSEERYWRGGEILRQLALDYPDTPLNWTIEFMGADAKTVTDRNEETGLVDYLLELKEEGLVEFGYHAHHDPTYTNKPQLELSKDYTWDEAYEAIHTWITCEKDPNYGGCVADEGGGLQAIMNTFGQVEIVTGLGLNDGTLIERSPGAQAVRDEIPDRWLSFGFPNHSAVLKTKGYTETRDEFLSLFVPTGDTSSGTLWMDNTISINDDASLEGAISIGAKEGVKNAISSIADADRSSPIVLNVGFLSKYVYTDSGTSPTKYGYIHPESPELTDEWLVSREETEEFYENAEATLTYLVKSFMPENEGSQFVTSDEVVDLFTSEDFWHVDEEELYQLSLWIVNHGSTQVPNYTYDGEDFYSLTDSFFLLLNGIRGDFPDEGIVSTYWGPWSNAEAGGAEMMWTNDFESWLYDFDENQIPEIIEISDKEWNPAQVLYALAYYYATNYTEGAPSSMFIGNVNPEPESYNLLEELGCNSCLDTAWSLKPARFQN
jgi:hypothetical protein